MVPSFLQIRFLFLFYLLFIFTDIFYICLILLHYICHTSASCRAVIVVYLFFLLHSCSVQIFLPMFCNFYVRVGFISTFFFSSSSQSFSSFCFRFLYLCAALSISRILLLSSFFFMPLFILSLISPFCLLALSDDLHILIYAPPSSFDIHLLSSPFFISFCFSSLC